MKAIIISSNITIMTILAVFNITLIILWCIILMPFEIPHFPICYISINLLGFLNIMLGIQGIILRKISILIVYATISLIFSCAIIALFILFIIDGGFKHGMSLYLIANYVQIVISLIKIASFVISIVFIRKIKAEMRVSPLSFINETLTEDLYDNVIRISKNPEDKKLKEKFDKLVNHEVLFQSTLSAERSMASTNPLHGAEQL